jgi:hypothetical protein
MIRPHWDGDKLMQGKRAMPIKVLPDNQWPGMYRVHYQGKISDMVNLIRAKDAAAAMVSASLNALQKPRPFSPTRHGGKGKVSPAASGGTPRPVSLGREASHAR